MYLEEFLRNNGVNPNDFIKRFGNVAYKIYEHYDDYIAKFSIYGEEQMEEVDLKDFMGLPDHLAPERYLLKSFTSIFNPEGDTYHSRANGMLQYKSDEVVSKLQGSFSKEPISFDCLGKDYFISSNGNHRIQLLVMHYFMDKYKGVDTEGKYKIPANVKHLDCVKTYTNYIGSLLWDKKFVVYSDYTDDNKKTGKSIVYYDKTSAIMNDDELIAFLRERLNNIKNIDEDYYKDVLMNIWNKCLREKTGLFKTFIKGYLQELEYLIGIEDYMQFSNAVNDELSKGVDYGNN